MHNYFLHLLQILLPLLPHETERHRGRIEMAVFIVRRITMYLVPSLVALALSLVFIYLQSISLSILSLFLSITFIILPHDT